jgi:UDP-2,3-diacylglucosamine pyrophosphatase LpxH
MSGIKARRVFVISDLHLGGLPPTMMSTPDRLAVFIESMPSRLQPDEQLELVINGDFVDFLAIEPCEAWTSSSDRAREKLLNTVGRSKFTPVFDETFDAWTSTSSDRAREKLPNTAGGSKFTPVFDALGRLVAAGHCLTILLGNHDLELAIPAVRDSLLDTLEATPHQVHCVFDGAAYRIGGALIEHGNRYDVANENDWDGLRTIASALSRGESSPASLRVSAGSFLVEKVVAALKPRYPFIDLLHPQGELLALLLAAFEPALVFDLPKVGRVFRANRLQNSNTRGVQPGHSYAVASTITEPPVDEELRVTFGAAYESLMMVSEQVSLSDVLFAAWNARRDSLSEILARGEDIPPARLEQIRVAMRRMLLDDTSDRIDGDTQQYGLAAQRITESSGGAIDVVLMGHTHLARHVGPPDRAAYINCGSWTDVIRVPRDVLAAGRHAELQHFLTELSRGGLRSPSATYADLRIERNGRVSTAKLVDLKQ